MIRKTSCFLIVVLAALSNPLLAEETGTGKPKSNNTTQQSSATTTTDCSWIDTVLGRCDATSEDSGSESL